ncbi:unnamed protein product [Kuraishia capsulata CBS 1993]|uniref:Vesicular-fusion protein SEC17 n=1 Tax=Kuraishia capsulata CBS 1993 TaxID=1382522 RepID=W6MWK0_9ASCO|nr:uncharacterized protein KUCA_T00003523001 [Kuraishia capsulata CBS 1993]CDK27545.1 unnamed protein product [Kuraishia capsulata CBS 1993]
MSDPEELIKLAEKKAKPSSGFSSFFSGNSTYRFEEAADFYIQAANIYKIRRENLTAGKTFERAAEAQLKADSKDEAANTLIEAYKAYKLEAPGDAARCLSKAIEFFVLKGQFRRGANFKADLGELYENDLHDIKMAIASYEEAGEWYRGDSALALSNKCLLKAADLYCEDEIGDYLKAGGIYESIAKGSLNNNLARWSLKDYFLKAILCRLALNDYPSAAALLGRFVSWDSTFQTTREHEFAAKLIDSVKEGDSDGVANAAREYDQFSRLDILKVRLLNKIKSGIQDAPEALEDDLT